MSDAKDELQHLAPLPWSAGSYGISDDNRRVALSLSIRLADKQNDANKRLLEMVVRAVNVHDELVDALHHTASLLSGFTRASDVISIAALQEAETVLARARG